MPVSPHRPCLACVIAMSVLAAASTARGADCNQNGVEDSLELSGPYLAPQSIRLAPSVSPAAFVVTDLDGDVRPDMAVVSFSPELKTWVLNFHRNDAQGGFVPPERLPLAAEVQPVTLVAADLNGDQALDLVMPDHLTGYLHVLLAGEDGRFAPAALTYPTGHANGNLNDLVAADFDADGDVDLAVSGSGRITTVVFVVKNDGRGAFGESEEVDLSQEITQLAAADFDGNGTMDLAGAGKLDLVVAWQQAEGFQAPVPYPAILDSSYQPPRRIAAGDLTGDGFVDLFATHGSRDLSLHVNDGHGAFPELRAFQGAQEAWDLHLADVDTDFDQDLILLYPGDLHGNNSGGRAIGIQRNDGLGHFASEEIYDVGDQPIQTRAADLDGDLDLDLAVLARQSSEVLWLRNLAQGSFSAPRAYALGENSRAIAGADLDGDGRLDIAVLRENREPYDRINVLWGEEGGRFEHSEDHLVYRRGMGRAGIQAADMNGDGLLDLVFSTGLVLNDGERRFHIPDCPECSLGGEEFEVADLDGDGVLDAVGLYKLFKRVRFLRNDGLGILSPAGSVDLPSEPGAIRAADLDGDNVVDLAVAQGSSVATLKGTGAWQFEQPVTHDLHAFPEWIEPIDLDGDLLVDLVAADLSVSVLWGQPAGKLSAATTFFVPLANHLEFLDHDQDSDVDVVAIADQEILALENQGDRQLEIAFSRRTSPAYLVAGDLGSGLPIDLAVFAREGTVIVLSSGAPQSVDCDQDGVPDGCQLAGNDCDGNGVLDACDLNRDAIAFARARIHATGSNPKEAVSADLDGDGIEDVVVASSAGDPLVEIFRSDGAGNLETMASLPLRDVQSASAGDLDGDGDADLAFARHTTGVSGDEAPEEVLVYHHQGAWTFEESPPLQIPRFAHSLSVADLDGDHDLDLLATSSIFSEHRAPEAGANRDVTVFLQHANGQLEPGASLDAGGPVVSAETSDVDGDGDVDLAVALVAGTVAIYLNAGDGGFQAGQRIPDLPIPRYLLARDLDADGDADVAFSGYGESRILLLRNAGDGTFPDSWDAPSERSTTGLAAADVDRDGDFDLLVGSSEVEASWILVLANDSEGGFAGAGRFPVGGLPLSPLAADLDGAGGPDLVVAHGRGGVSVLLNQTPRLASPDCDGNGVLDACDPDEDGDGVNDVCDLCPGEDDGLDADGDGSPDCLPVSLHKLVRQGSVRPFVRGDHDASGFVQITDAILTLGYLFRDSEAPPCLRALDADDDGVVNITDPIYTLGFLFLGTAPIPEPYPRCGLDLETDALGCEGQASCRSAS